MRSTPIENGWYIKGNPNWGSVAGTGQLSVPRSWNAFVARIELRQRVVAVDDVDQLRRCGATIVAAATAAATATAATATIAAEIVVVVASARAAGDSHERQDKGGPLHDRRYQTARPGGLVRATIRY